jgi:hypothetical protein
MQKKCPEYLTTQQLEYLRSYEAMHGVVKYETTAVGTADGKSFLSYGEEIRNPRALVGSDQGQQPVKRWHEVN